MVTYEIRSEGGSIRASNTPVKASAEQTARMLALGHPGQTIVLYRNGKRVNSWTDGPKSDSQW
jgi:hypothetical protein